MSFGKRHSRSNNGQTAFGMKAGGVLRPAQDSNSTKQNTEIKKCEKSPYLLVLRHAGRKNSEAALGMKLGEHFSACKKDQRVRPFEWTETDCGCHVWRVS